jgi:hypothetical protein
VTEGAITGPVPLARHGPRPSCCGMFAVTEAEAALIRTAYFEGGEFSAAVELRRLFPGIEDMARARECARTITGWTPITAPVPPRGKARKPRKGEDSQ